MSTDHIPADKTFFVLGTSVWDTFKKSLDSPAAPNPKLEHLLAAPSVLDGGAFSDPRLGSSTDDIADFHCGHEYSDTYLRWWGRRTGPNGAQCYVTVAEGRLVGFYSLVQGLVARELLGGSSGWPQPIPILIIGHLAVDLGHQGAGVGRGLARDAIHRAARCAEQSGARAIAVDTLRRDSATFWSKLGFLPTPLDPHHRLIRLADTKLPQLDRDCV